MDRSPAALSLEWWLARPVCTLESALGLQADWEVRPVVDQIAVAGHSRLVDVGEDSPVDHLGEDSPVDRLGEGSRFGLEVVPMIRKQLDTHRQELEHAESTTNISSIIGLLTWVRRVSMLLLLPLSLVRWCAIYLLVCTSVRIL